MGHVVGDKIAGSPCTVFTYILTTFTAYHLGVAKIKRKGGQLTEGLGAGLLWGPDVTRGPKVPDNGFPTNNRT